MSSPGETCAVGIPKNTAERSCAFAVTVIDAERNPVSTLAIVEGANWNEAAAFATDLARESYHNGLDGGLASAVLELNKHSLELYRRMGRLGGRASKKVKGGD